MANGSNGYVGPMLGQHHQFHHYNLEKVNLEKTDILKFQKESKELDERLLKSQFCLVMIIRLQI